MADFKFKQDTNHFGNAVIDPRFTAITKNNPATNEGVFGYSVAAHRPQVVTNSSVANIVISDDLLSYVAKSDSFAGDVVGTYNNTQIATGVIVNSDINASAAIAWTKIDKTGSNLTDLATRSHSSLQNLTADDHSIYTLVTGARAFTGKQQGVSTGAGDAGTVLATKDYVDAKALDAKNGKDFKDACRVATTANITLSGLQTIDGITLIAGDRVLVKDQSTAAQNGIYTASASAWSRATDADEATEVTSGMTTVITDGTINGGTVWTLKTADSITLGTTALQFILTKASDQTSAISIGGVAVYYQMNGNQMQFKGAASTTSAITVTANTTTFDFAFVPSAVDINALSSSLGIAKGGTGATDANTALKNLGAVAQYNGTFAYSAGSPSATSWVITHNLNNTKVMVSIYDSTGNPAFFGLVRTDANTLTIQSNYPLVAGETYDVIIQSTRG